VDDALVVRCRQRVGLSFAKTVVVRNLKDLRTSLFLRHTPALKTEARAWPISIAYGVWIITGLSKPGLVPMAHAP